MCNGLGDYLNMCGGVAINALGFGVQAQQVTCTREGMRALSIPELQNIRIRQAMQMFNAYTMQHKKALPAIPPRPCALHWRNPEDRV
jgi:hypothetical protein